MFTNADYLMDNSTQKRKRFKQNILNNKKYINFPLTSVI